LEQGVGIKENSRKQENRREKGETGGSKEGVSGWKWKNDALARRRASLLFDFMAFFLSKNPFFQVF